LSSASVGGLVYHCLTPMPSVLSIVDEFGWVTLFYPNIGNDNNGELVKKNQLCQLIGPLPVLEKYTHRATKY